MLQLAFIQPSILSLPVRWLFKPDSNYVSANDDICPIVGGIPFMLFLTKTKKFGMITIMGILMGLVML